MSRLMLVASSMMLSIGSASLPADEVKPARPPITIHALDTARGKPAAGLGVVLERADGKEWKELGRGKTDADGRANALYPKDQPLASGVYRVVYQTGDYFAEQKVKTLYPQVIVIFEVEAATEHYHVPLLLSPFGYSTYRGS